MDQQPTSPMGRPRPRSRGISFNSNKSDESKGSKSRPVESPADKARRDSFWKGASKANPNAAINESQPGEAQTLEQSTLASIREYRHKDANGNVIADPDLSNPTRPRLERPLDTIRSFEKAIDQGYRRRSSFKQEPNADQYDQNNQYASRRSSYFGGESQDPNNSNTHPQAPANKRPTPGYDNGPSPNRHAQQQGGYYGNQNGGQQRMRGGGQGGNRMDGQQRPYPQHGYHQSYDTVNTGVTNGSDSTGPWANSTDPSSENSSIERVNAMGKPQQDGYGGSYGGQNGYNGPIMEDQGAGDYPYQNGYGQQQGGYGGGPPRRQGTGGMDGGARRPMQLNGGAYAAGPPPTTQLPSTKREPEKRKSWFGRRFSKKE